VDVRIGIIHTGKELDIEVADGTDRDALLEEVEKALSGDGAILWLTDKRGKRVAIPSEKIAYIEVSALVDDRRVGFGAP